MIEMYSGLNDQPWGEHHCQISSGGECGVPFEKRSGMPLPGKDKWWYSFDFGPIHFLQYSTEHDFAPGGTVLQSSEGFRFSSVAILELSNT